MKKLLLASLFLTIAMTSFGQLQGASARCVGLGDPNLDSDISTIDILSDCSQYVDSATGAKWDYNPTLAAGSRWELAGTGATPEFEVITGTGISHTPASIDLTALSTPNVDIFIMRNGLMLEYNVTPTEIYHYGITGADLILPTNEPLTTGERLQLHKR